MTGTAAAAEHHDARLCPLDPSAMLAKRSAHQQPAMPSDSAVSAPLRLLLMVQRLPRLNSSRHAGCRRPFEQLRGRAAASKPSGAVLVAVSLIEMACRVTFRAAHDLPDDGDRAATAFRASCPHQAAIDPTHLHRR
jgi:hypothetical protein